MTRRSGEFQQETGPIAYFASVAIRDNIRAYRKGNKAAARFLFEGDYLNRFLEDLNFESYVIDKIRQRIVANAKLVSGK